MARTSQHLKPDTVLKNYWRDNSRFADFFNAVLFDGKAVILPDELEDLDTEESSVLEHRKYAESIEASRDNIKIRKRSSAFGAEFVMLGKESQSHIHYSMPLRVMGYDYGTYKKQYEDIAATYQSSDGLDPDEYLSRMKKTDKLIPVITVVVYYGEKSWDGAKSLHEMLRIPAEIAPYVNDHKMILVEARQNNLALHNTNNIDFFHLLEIILDRSLSRNKARQKAIQYDEEHTPDKSVIMAVAGAANRTMNYHMFEEGEVRMCTLFDEIKVEGRLEGKLEGRAEEIVESGYEFHLSERDILERLQKKLDVSLQKAQEYFNMYKKPAL